jgi:predicted transglutaminase-like cysteine proteinase
MRMWFVPWFFVGLAVTALSCAASASSVATAPVSRIKLDTPALAPMAYTRFCLAYADACKERSRRSIKPARLADRGLDALRTVNDAVNAAIVPLQHQSDLANETWLIAPQVGDYNDYAVTRRHLLLSRGWPQAALLLAEVAKSASTGRHHLVLVVRTEHGDIVLDNLTGEIMPWTAAPYRWVRIQSSTETKLWARVAN